MKDKMSKSGSKSNSTFVEKAKRGQKMCSATGRDMDMKEGIARSAKAKPIKNVGVAHSLSGSQVADID